MAEHELTETAKAELEAGREARAESMRVFGERTKGRPTPTQEENDEAALGKSFVGIEHSADGSDPDPNEEQRRHLEAGRGGNYATRQAQPSRTRAVPTTPSGSGSAT